MKTIARLRTATAALLTLVAITTINAMPDRPKPDFAFPLKVEKKAGERLRTALRTDDGPATVGALLDITLARTSADPSAIGQAIALADSVAGQTSSDVTRSVITLLQAAELVNVYQSDRWTFDNRQIPLRPIPADIRQWSGDQFRVKVDSLCRAALAPAAQLRATPISGWSDAVTSSRASEKYYPTLYDFVANKSIQLLTTMLPPGGLPLSALTPADSISAAVGMLESIRPQQAEILKIYESLISFHRDDLLPRTAADLGRISFIRSRIYPQLYQSAQSRADRLLRDLYSGLSATAAAPEVLEQIASNADISSANSTDARWLYENLQRVIRDNPSYPRINCLKNHLTTLTQPEAGYTMPQVVTPGQPFDVAVNVRNMNTLTLTLHPVRIQSPTDSYYSVQKGQALPAPVATATIKFDGKVPFAADSTVRFTVDKPGHYILVARTTDGKAPEQRSYRIIHSTHFAVGMLTYSERRALVVDRMTGRPVDGAAVSVLPPSRNAALQPIGTTGSDGFAAIPTGTKGNIFVSKAGDSFAPPIYTWVYDNSTTSGTAVEALTDLAIYRPGDKVQWMAVAYKYDGERRSAAESLRLRAILLDANATPADTAEATTDPFGRISGEFTLPTGVLTGRFSIRFEPVAEKKPATLGSVGFMVSDYKLPTFKVETPMALRDTPSEGSITLRGRAMTYAGMPVVGASVKIDIASLPRLRWFYSHSDPFMSLTSETDAEGRWTIVLNPGDIQAAPYPDGIFTAEATVTSTAAESHTAQCTFANGPAYTITASPATDIDVAQPVDLHIAVKGPDGNDTTATVGYSFISTDGKPALTGKIDTSSPTLDLGKMKSGIYTLTLSMPQADTLRIDNIALYRPTDPMPPRKSVIWLPTREFDTPASILYGTSAPTTFLLATVWDSDTILSQKWIEQRAGIHTLDVSLPGKCQEAHVSLLSTYEGSTESYEITVRNPKGTPRIAVESSTFRDRLTPGSGESWTLTVRNSDGSPAEAALILDVYNAALDAISRSSFTINPRSGYTPRLSVTQPQSGGTANGGFTIPSRYLDCTSIDVPDFETFGLQLASGAGRRLYMSRSMATMKAESVEEDAVAVADYALAAPAMMKKAAITIAGSADNGASAVTEEEAAPADADNSAESFAYRPGEIALALFRPMITTDADGNAVCTFTVPEANATWKFNAVAFTRSLLTARYTAEVTAAKRVMVTPNPPRFVRTADSIRIDATVFNNTSDSINATAVIEIFEPSTGKVTGSRTLNLPIGAGRSAIASIDAVAPSSAPFMGYRVRAIAGESSDGEQLLIPVLPSSTPVVGSIPFCLSPDSASFTLDLPQCDPGSVMTLRYCDNPLWYAVTALPGLISRTPSTATDAAEVIFSASVASDLLRRYPALAEAVKEWKESADRDSMLTSLLQRNSNLKIMLLNATPWMADAAADTERMTRLALLFDRTTVDATISGATAILSSLSSDDGGWNWSAGSTRWSEWTTMRVLNTLGLLNRSEIPVGKEIESMAMKAMNRIQEEAVRQQRKGNDANALAFARLSTLWPSFRLSTQGAAVKAEGINVALRKWKQMPLAERPALALLLHDNGHANVARTLIESIAEYARTSPEGSMWWPSVSASGQLSPMLTFASDAISAMAAITPGNPDIDRVRQWLILQKITTDWRQTSAATSAVQAIVTASPQWIGDAGKVDITVGGAALDNIPAQPRTGEITADLSSYGGKTLTIARTGRTPAWGSVMKRLISPMREVPAESSGTISIRKEFYKKSGNGWIAADTIMTGDRIKVELIIQTNQMADYVVINDSRAACFEPVQQTPGYILAEGLPFYRENNDAATNIFIDRLPAGTYRLSYEVWANNAGRFASGIATIQSQYAPEITAHSAGTEITVE